MLPALNHCLKQRIGEDTMELKEAHDIVYEKLGFCGCGLPETALGFVHKALKLIQQRCQWHEENEELSIQERLAANPSADIDKLFGNPSEDEDAQGRYWILWYFLDRAELIEHGGNVSGSWLTEKGKQLLACLEAHEADDILEYSEPYVEP